MFSRVDGVFKNVPQLKAAIYDYVDHNNEQAQGFTWIAKFEESSAKVRRARATLDNAASG